jgi:N-acylneuraminate cytidylyltransferase
MIGHRKVLGVIAARGGSKSLPGKNTMRLGGKSLVGWSVAAASQARYLDRAIVSTDNSEIAEAARLAGGDVPFLRPPELATDQASIVDAVLHAVDHIEGSYDYVVLLQATSPLRTASDIDAAIALCCERNASTCVSVTTVTKGPWWMFRIDLDGYLQPFLDHVHADQRRQDFPSLFMPNGAVYVAELAYVRRSRSFYGERTVAYEMPPERSPDIDTIVDFRLAEALLDARSLAARGE